MALFSNHKKTTPVEKEEMSFVEHLDELRSHLFKSAIAIFIGGIIMWYFNSFFINQVLMGPIHKNFPTYKMLCNISHKIGLGQRLCIETVNVNMQSNTVAGQFGVFFNILIIGGFIIAFPYVFYQFWKFVRPALSTKEMHTTKGAIFWVSILFFSGVAFGYFIIAPYTVNFFAKFSLDPNIENRWTIASYFNTLVPIILAAGLAFQLPLVIYFLTKAGAVNAAWLKKVRRYAILIIFVLAAIITPPDMFSQIICALPLMLLYEIGILLAKRVEKNEKAAEKEWS